MAAASAAAIAFPRSGGAHSPRTHVVRIKAFRFQPAVLSVRAGDRIRWINDDIAPHTATATDESWDTGELKRGEAAEITVRKEMKRSYFCRFHPVMKAKLEIQRTE